MRPINRPIRWGILGTGAIAAAFATALRQVTDATLFAVGSRSQTSADDFAQTYDLVRAFASYAELAADPDVDVVYIASPHTAHFEHTMLCLGAGKHVLCEKPFALNSTQTEQMVALAKHNGLFLMEAMWMRFIPLIIELRRRVDAGEIGQVRMIQADFGFRAPRNPHSRLFNPELAGGALLDLGIYPLAFSALLLGAPTEITSLANIGTTGVDEQSAYVLKHEGGELSVLASALRTQTSMSAWVYGTDGRIHLPKQFWRAKEMVLYRNEMEPESIHLPYAGNGYQFEAQEVVDCLRDGKTESEIMPLRDSESLMGTMDTIRRQWGLTYPNETE
jgi:predicted dehydrogenase